MSGALVCNGCGCGLAVSTPGNRLSTRLFQVGDSYWHEQCAPYDLRADMEAMTQRLSQVCECTCGFALGPCMVHTDRVTVFAGVTYPPRRRRLEDLPEQTRNALVRMAGRMVAARILRMRVPV